MHIVVDTCNNQLYWVQMDLARTAVLPYDTLNYDGWSIPLPIRSDSVRTQQGNYDL